MAAKTILLGISGGIAAYKAASLASLLTKKGYRVLPVMTEHAAEFISPLTFEAVCGNPCPVRMFEETKRDPIPHIHLAEAADLILIAPATANIIAKIAHGIADDLLSSTVLAAASFGPYTDLAMGLAVSSTQAGLKPLVRAFRTDLTLAQAAQ